MREWDSDPFIAQWISKYMSTNFKLVQCYIIHIFVCMVGVFALCTVLMSWGYKNYYNSLISKLQERKVDMHFK